MNHFESVNNVHTIPEIDVNEIEVIEEESIGIDQYPLKMLIVDDELYNLIPLEGILTYYFPDCIIDKASNGVEALGLIENRIA
jgi:hypothetical protein